MPDPRTARRASTRALSALMLLLGAAILVRTIALGGGQVGILMGVLFMAAGAGRFYLARRDG